MAVSLLEQLPNVVPPLDPDFRPAALGNRAFRAAAQSAGGTRLAFALERGAGSVSRFEALIFPEDHPEGSVNLRYAERLLKFLLWQKGGFRVFVAGSPAIAAHLAAEYAPHGRRAFDAE